MSTYDEITTNDTLPDDNTSFDTEHVTVKNTFSKKKIFRYDRIYFKKIFY